MGRALAAVSRELELGVRRGPRRESRRPLRTELDDQLRALYGKAPHPRQLDALEVIVPWLGRCAKHEGAEFIRSIPQCVRGIAGWTPTGTCRSDQNRYRNQILRRLDALARIGWVDAYEPVYRPSGEGRGILIRLTPAGVAQSVGRAPYRGVAGASFDAVFGSSAGRFSSSGGECPPPVGSTRRPGESPRTACSSFEAAGAGAREGPSRKGRERWHGQLPDGRDPAAWQDRCRAALGVRWSLVGIEDGPSLLEALPWLVDAPPTAVARALLELASPGVAPRISWCWQRRLERAVRMMDRYADFGKGRRGAGMEQLINICLGDWEEFMFPNAPYSLGAVAVCARRLAREWRRHDRARGARRDRERQLATLTVLPGGRLSAPGHAALREAGA